MEHRDMRPLQLHDWGRLDYARALERQLALVDRRIEDRVPDSLVLVEHPPVITVGRSGGQGDLRVPKEALTLAGIDLHFVDRGGQATWHGPGQLVAYPVVKVVSKDLHAHLDLLLETTADLLRSYGLAPEKKPGRPGLWVRGAKIASVGLAARRWVTYHGLALNVCNDLSGFRHIVPCGRTDERVTSMAEALDRRPDPAEVRGRFVRAFADRFGYRLESSRERTASRHPAWLVRPAPDTEAIDRMENRLDRLRLSTVCQSAHCPNLGECFGQGTATFMILGRNCTRACRFCAVDKNRPETVDEDEPERVALAARSLGLRHVVVTSVTRDDLPDGGAGHFARVIAGLRRRCPEARVEVLTPDFGGSVQALDRVLAARPDVFNHNLETVSRLYGAVRPKARYRRSLAVLGRAAGYGLPVKSGLMLGLGETDGEIRNTLRDIRRTGCAYLTLGQYLAPSPEHLPVRRYVTPEEFDDWAGEAGAMGFTGVAAGPLVRSSYMAEALFTSNDDDGKRGYGEEKVRCGIGNRH